MTRTSIPPKFDGELPPHDHFAERTALGAILMNPEAASAALRGEHFTDPMAGAAYTLAVEMHRQGLKISPMVLSEPLHSAFPHVLKDRSTAANLLSDCIVGAIGCDEATQRAAAGIIISVWAQRQLWELAREEPGDINDTMAHYDATLDAIKRSRDGLQARQITLVPALSEAIGEVQEAYRHGGLVGVSTGLRNMDDKLCGLKDGELIVIAGRPSMGKTGMARGIAVSAAETGIATYFASLEMTRAQIAMQVLAEKAGVDAFALRNGYITQGQWPAVMNAKDSLADLQLLIDDSATMTVADLSARTLAASPKPGLIVVDYLQLMKPVERRRMANRTEEVGEISAGLKELARRAKCPVVALAQLSRAVEQREDKRPTLADLRESGSIEQDADQVILLHRQEYYLERSEPDPGNTEKWGRWRTILDNARGRAEAIIAKNRHGPVGTVQLGFKASNIKFHDLGEDPR